MVTVSLMFCWLNFYFLFVCLFVATSSHLLSTNTFNTSNNNNIINDLYLLKHESSGSWVVSGGDSGWLTAEGSVGQLPSEKDDRATTWSLYTAGVSHTGRGTHTQHWTSTADESVCVQSAAGHHGGHISLHQTVWVLSPSHVVMSWWRPGEVELLYMFNLMSLLQIKSVSAKLTSDDTLYLRFTTFRSVCV